MESNSNKPENSTLGKKTEYVNHYDPTQLFPIPRKAKRSEIGLQDNALPFSGVDCWNGYELSWLNHRGKPQVAIATFLFPCESLNIIESKSFKLYLNSFNQSQFTDWANVQEILKNDLSEAVKAEVSVQLFPADGWKGLDIGQFDGYNLDDLDIEVTDYDLNPSYLKTVSSEEIVQEKLVSSLLKSNCLVTGQPDWGTVFISYQGKKIDHEGLLKYIISFRQHNEFHEQCVERIFHDIQKLCSPSELTVYARYTRRGGLDINPFRSNCELFSHNKRMGRQ